MNQTDNSIINIHIPSETAMLKTVVTCLANPIVLRSILQNGGFDIPLLYQLWYNKFNFFYDYKKVIAQQLAFIELMQSNGIEVLYAQPQPGCATQHYTRDIGFAIDHIFFCANPRRPYRQRELAGIKNILSRVSNQATLDSGSIEGGDVIVDEKNIIIGLSEETNLAGVNCLREKLAELSIAREVVTIEFSHRGIIHLDTKFNIPAQGLGFIHPKSFKPASLKWLENNFDLIEATDQETRNIEINTFALSPKKVVMLESSERLASILAGKGVEPVLIDYSEVTKLPGSFRCTTLPLARCSTPDCRTN